MKVEIWSDIACPFCYIGKAHIEKALSSFENAEDVEVLFKSYQLDPEYHNSDGEDVFTHLSEKKRMSLEQVRQMTERVNQMATETGLVIDFEKNIPANTIDAHRLIHLAYQEACGEEVLTALFKAYFTEGKNIEKVEVLEEIGLESGIKQEKLDSFFSSEDFAYDVKQDILESRNLGIRGVPFFLFNRKYAVSGAQPVEVFEEVLEKSFGEWRKGNPALVNVGVDDAGMCADDSCEI